MLHILLLAHKTRALSDRRTHATHTLATTATAQLTLRFVLKLRRLLQQRRADLACYDTCCAGPTQYCGNELYDYVMGQRQEP